MPPAYETIKTLSPGKNDKGIILRLVRKYDLPDYYGGKRPLSLECIFHDSEGERIHDTMTHRSPCKRCFFNEGDSNYCQVECNSGESMTCLYLTNMAAIMLGTTSRYITLQTPEPQAFQVFYEYRMVGNKKRSSIMIRLTEGWGAVAEQLDLEQGNAVRIKICDNLDECFHVKQIPIVNIDFDRTST